MTKRHRETVFSVPLARSAGGFSDLRARKKESGLGKLTQPALHLSTSSGEPVAGRKSEGSRTTNMMSSPLGVNSPFPRTVDDINALREAVSPARLGTYIKRSHGNVRRAFDLYAWNVQASAALYPILQVNEIALRNAVNRALVSQFGTHWPYSQGFLRSLHKIERESFERARTRLEAKLRVGRVSTDHVVATQTYWFWVMLLTSRFENRLWKREFTNSFPSVPPRIDRSVVHDRADSSDWSGIESRTTSPCWTMT